MKRKEDFGPKAKTGEPGKVRGFFPGSVRA